jgi:hypothetical protein
MASVESYAHLSAKKTLVDWLRTTAEASGRDEYANMNGIEWRVNRGSPYWGVWEEYPFTKDTIETVWDEMGYGVPPTYEELKKQKNKPFVILDVAIQHKGMISHGFEVVHKNGVSQKKKELLHKLNCGVYVISAAWILSQVKKPSKLVFIDYIARD